MKEKRGILKDSFVILIVILLLGAILLSGVASSVCIMEELSNGVIHMKCDEIEETDVFDDEMKNIVLADTLAADLKIRKQNPDGSWGNWQDNSITATVGTKLEFKIDVSSTLSHRYLGVFVTVFLPEINGSPMFTYIAGSASDPFNLLEANDKEVVWSYVAVHLASPKEMTFKAKIVKPGSKSVNSTVFSIMPDTYDNLITDSVHTTSTEDNSFYFSTSTNTYNNFITDPVHTTSTKDNLFYSSSDTEISMTYDELENIENVNDCGSPGGLFSSIIHTKCGEIEKSTEIIFGLYTDIDVDDDPNTGINGLDVRVQYLILPWIELDFDIGVGLFFTVRVERLGEEIKDSDFSAALEIGQNDIRVGYCSPGETGNEIPDYTRVTFKIFFYLLERTRGFGLAINPQYDSGNEGKKIELFAEYNSDETQRSYSIEFDPAIKIEATFTSTKTQGVWKYDFVRISSEESKVTSTITTNAKKTTLTIDRLPDELLFSLGLTPFTPEGGQFLYESSEMYNIELLIESDELGTCRYSLIRNTPRRIFAEWIPTLTNGEYHIEIDSGGTDFIVKNSPDNPSINFELNGLETIVIDAYWNLTNPGDFTVYKNNTLKNVELDFNIGGWSVQLNAQPTANYISTTWLIAVSGYLTIDTNWEPFSSIDLLVKGPTVGLHTVQ